MEIKEKKGLKSRIAGIMRSRDARMLMLVAVFLIVGAIVLAQDVTITTYYPAPYGVYNELRAKKIGIGDNWYDSSSYPIADPADLIVEGNVGIGTASPQRNLHIRSDLANVPRIYLEGVAPAGLPGIEFAFDATATRRSIIRTGAVGTQGTNLEFFTKPDSAAGTTSRVFIGADGNVGIGTANPGAKLHVGDTAGTDGIMFPDGTLQTTAAYVIDIQLRASNSSSPPPGPAGYTLVGYWDVDDGGGVGTDGSWGHYMMAMYVLYGH